MVIKMNEILSLSPNELYHYIKKHIVYGFVDKNNNKYLPKDFNNVDVDSLYILQSPKEVIENKCAWCWDVIELIRYYFEQNNIYNETYYMEYKDDKNNIHHTHTFIIFKNTNKWYNIEDNSSNNENGVFEYNSKDDLIYTITKSFKEWIKSLYNLTYADDYFVCLKYNKPTYGISAQMFQKFCKKGQD